MGSANVFQLHHAVYARQIRFGANIYTMARWSELLNLVLLAGSAPVCLVRNLDRHRLLHFFIRKRQQAAAGPPAHPHTQPNHRPV